MNLLQRKRFEPYPIEACLYFALEPYASPVEAFLHFCLQSSAAIQTRSRSATSFTVGLLPYSLISLKQRRPNQQRTEPAVDRTSEENLIASKQEDSCQTAMDPYRRGTYGYRDNNYPPPRTVPRNYDPFPQVEYRQADRVYAAPPAAMSYPGVEYRYYDPTMGLPVPMPLPPAPAPTVAPAPPRQIQLPCGSGSQFQPGQMYKVVGVEETPIYHAAPPPQQRTLEYVAHDYGYPSVPRGPPPHRPYYQQY